MPTSLVFRLRPTTRAVVPANLGRAAHAVILARIAEAHLALAARLHTEQGIKPLTVSNILGLNDRTGYRAAVSPINTYGLRVTMLCDPLEELADHWIREPWASLELGSIDWRVERITADPAVHPWARRESYEALAASTLRKAVAAPCQWDIEYSSPSTFRSGPINHPLPLPELVFRSLLEKWNAFSPLPLPLELYEPIAHLVVSGFDLRSVALPTKGGALQIGAIGRCGYRLLGDDCTWLAGIDLLARFAIYSGIGAGTARGFGQARLLAVHEQQRSTAAQGRVTAASDSYASPDQVDV